MRLGDSIFETVLENEERRNANPYFNLESSISPKTRAAIARSAEVDDMETFTRNLSYEHAKEERNYWLRHASPANIDRVSRDYASNILAYQSFDRQNNPDKYKELDYIAQEYGINNPQLTKEQLDRFRFDLYRKEYEKAIDAHGALPEDILRGMADYSRISPDTYNRLASLYRLSQERQGNNGFSSGWDADHDLAQLDYDLEAGRISPETYSNMQRLYMLSDPGFMYGLGSALHSMWGGIEQNYGTIAATALAGGLIGGAGLVALAPVTLAGSILSAAASGVTVGNMVGIGIAQAKDTFVRTRSQIVGDVMSANPYLDESLVRDEASIYAVSTSAMDAVSMVIGGALGKGMMNFAGRLSRGISSFAKDPKKAKARYRERMGIALAEYIAMISTEGLTEGFQGVIQEAGTRGIISNRELRKYSDELRRSRAEQAAREQTKPKEQNQIMQLLSPILGQMEQKSEQKAEEGTKGRDGYAKIFVDNAVAGASVATILGGFSSGSRYIARRFMENTKNMNDTISSTGEIIEENEVLGGDMDQSERESRREVLNEALNDQPLYFRAREIYDYIRNHTKADSEENPVFTDLKDKLQRNDPKSRTLDEIARADETITIKRGDFIADWHDTEEGDELLKFAKKDPDADSVTEASRKYAETSNPDVLRMAVEEETEEKKKRRKNLSNFRRSVIEEMSELRALAKTKPDILREINILSQYGKHHGELESNEVAKAVREAMRKGDIFDERIINGIATLNQEVYETFSDIVGKSGAKGFIKDMMFKIVNETSSINVEGKKDRIRTYGSYNPLEKVISIYRHGDQISDVAVFMHEYAHYFLDMIDILYLNLNSDDYMKKIVRETPELMSGGIDEKEAIAKIRERMNSTLNFSFMKERYGLGTYDPRDASVGNMPEDRIKRQEIFVGDFMAYIFHGGFLADGNKTYDDLRRGLVSSIHRARSDRIEDAMKNYVFEYDFMEDENGKYQREINFSNKMPREEYDQKVANGDIETKNLYTTLNSREAAEYVSMDWFNTIDASLTDEELAERMFEFQDITEFMNALTRTDDRLEEIYQGMDLTEVARELENLARQDERFREDEIIASIRKLVGASDEESGGAPPEIDPEVVKNEKGVRRILDTIEASTVLRTSPSVYRGRIDSSLRHDDESQPRYVNFRRGGGGYEIDRISRRTDAVKASEALDIVTNRFKGSYGISKNGRLYKSIESYFRMLEREADEKLRAWKTVGKGTPEENNTYNILTNVIRDLKNHYINEADFRGFLNSGMTGHGNEWKTMPIASYLYNEDNQIVYSKDNVWRDTYAEDTGRVLTVDEFMDRYGIKSYEELYNLFAILKGMRLDRRNLQLRIEDELDNLEREYDRRHYEDRSVERLDYTERYNKAAENIVRNDLILPGIARRHPFTGYVDRHIANMMTHTKEASELVALLNKSLGLTTKGVRKRIKEIAAEQLGSMRLADMSSVRLKTRITKSQKDFLAALRKGDLQTARQHLYESAIWRDVMAQAIEFRSSLRGKIEKRSRIFNRSYTADRKTEKGKKLHFDKDVFEMGKYVMLRIKGNTTSLPKVTSALEQIKELNPDLADAISNITKLDREDMRLSRMSKMQIERVINLLDMIESEGRALYKANQAVETREARARLAQAVKSLGRQGFKQKIIQTMSEDGFDTGHDVRRFWSMSKLRETWGRYWRHTVARPMHFFNSLDEGNSNGVFNRVFVRPIMEGMSQTNYQNKELSRQIEEVLKSEAVKKYFNMDSIIDLDHFRYRLGGSGETYRRGYKELFVLLLNCGNVGNLKRLKEKFDPDGRLKDQDAFNTELEKQIYELVERKVITKEYMDAVQKIWDIFDGAGKRAQQAHHDVYGTLMTMVEKQKWKLTFDGEETTYAGGYVPIVYDRDISTERTPQLDEFSQDQITKGLAGGIESAANNLYGFTKDRVKVAPKGQKLDFSLERILNEIYKINTFACMMPVCNHMHRILNSRNEDGTSLHSVLNSYFPRVYEDLILPYMLRAVTNSTRYGGERTAMTRVLDAFQSRLGRSIMFGNVVNTAQQITQFFPAATEIKPVYLIQSAGQFFRGTAKHKEYMDAIKEKSVYMRTRLDYRTTEYENFGRLVSDNQFTSAINAAVGAGSANARHIYNVCKDFSQKYSYVLQAALQHQIDAIVWNAAYNEAIMSKGMKPQDAVYHADKTVAITQTGFTAADVSNFEASNNAFSRMLGMFYSFFNNQLNMSVYQIARIWRSHEKLHSRLYAVTLNHLLTLAIPFIASEVITQFLSGNDLWKMDDEETWDYMKRMVFVPYGHGMLTTIPTGGVFQTGFDKLMGVDTYFSSRFQLNMPVLTTATQIVTSGTNLASSVVNGDEFHKNVVRDVARAASIVTGISPIDLVGREINILYELSRGNIDEQWASPWQMFRLLMTTRVSEEEKK